MDWVDSGGSVARLSVVPLDATIVALGEAPVVLTTPGTGSPRHRTHPQRCSSRPWPCAHGARPSDGGRPEHPDDERGRRCAWIAPLISASTSSTGPLAPALDADARRRGCWPEPWPSWLRTRPDARHCGRRGRAWLRVSAHRRLRRHPPRSRDGRCRRQPPTTTRGYCGPEHSRGVALRPPLRARCRGSRPLPQPPPRLMGSGEPRLRHHSAAPGLHHRRLLFG